MIVGKRTTTQLPLVKDESCNERGGTQGDSQTTLSFGCSVSMSAAKTDSPFISALVLFLRLCGRIKYAEICGYAVCVCKMREITGEASVSLRGVGRAGYWGRVEMTNGLLCN